MQIKILKEDVKGFEFEIIGGEHGICNLLVDYLNNMKEVNFAAYRVEHPLISNPKVFVSLKNNAKSVEKEVKPTPITKIKGVGRKKAEAFEKAGIKYAEDLLKYTIEELCNVVDIDEKTAAKILGEAEKITKKDIFGYRKVVKEALKKIEKDFEEIEKKFAKLNV